MLSEINFTLEKSLRARTQRRLGSSQQFLYSRYLFLTAKSLLEKHAHLQMQVLQLTARSSNETLNLKVLPLTMKDAHYKSLFSSPGSQQTRNRWSKTLWRSSFTTKALPPSSHALLQMPPTHTLTTDKGARPFHSMVFPEHTATVLVPANRCSLPLAFFSNNSTFLKESTVLAPRAAKCYSI